MSFVVFLFTFAAPVSEVVFVIYATFPELNPSAQLQILFFLATFAKHIPIQDVNFFSLVATAVSGPRADRSY